MLTNHGKSDNSSSDVLTIGNNNSMYIHSGGDDYYLPPSAERDDSSVHSGSERNDSMLGSTIPEDIDDDNLGIKEYGSFAPQSKQDFSSPVSLRPPVRFPTPTVPLPPSRPPTLHSLSNQRPSIPPSVANTSAATSISTTSQYPPSPSNTFQEFLSGEEYKRPVILSPYDDSHFHLVDEKTRAKQSSPPKKAATTSTSTTSKTTNSSSSNTNSTNHTSTTSTTTSVKSSNGTTTTTFEPKNNQVGLKTLLAQKQQQQLQQQKEDKMETDEKTKEDKKEEKVKDEKPKKTTKTTKKKSKKESDSESEYVNESESDDSDKKPSKKTKKKEKIKKPTKPKTTKKETKKEEEKKEITKKETRSSKKEITVSSPKRTLDPSGSENETNGSDEPKSKKNKITSSSLIVEPIITATKPSVETIVAPVVKTTSQIVKEKLESRKTQTRTEDPPKKKSETKQTLAKKQKHTADDKMKQKKSSEAISYYLRAGILFSEGAHFSKEAYLSASRDNKSNYFHDAVNLLQQTVAYLKQIAKMALQHGEIQKAALTHLLLFTTVKVWFKLKSETIVKYKNYLMALMTKVNEMGGSTGNSQSTSPSVTSPQSVSTPSPIHGSANATEGIQKREVEKLCKELDVVSQLAEQEDNLNLQLKNYAVYREDSELMIRVYQGDLMFVTMFIEEELIKLDVF